jgi:hypothetical protein
MTLSTMASVRGCRAGATMPDPGYREGIELDRLCLMLRRHISCTTDGEHIYLTHPEATLRWLERLERERTASHD